MDRNIELLHRSESDIIPKISSPRLGLGVYNIPSSDTGIELIKYALKVGYRHIDTASIYDNELEVGKAIETCGLSRADLFITTKLWPLYGPQDYVQAFEESLTRLGLDYIDLYLIHAPPQHKYRKIAWKTMEDLLITGKSRAIGVSNYGISHLEELFDYADIYPSVNQIELSPYLQRKDLVQFCKNNDIALTAYSPITRGLKLKDPKLREMASKYGKTPAQLLIRWSLQNDFIVIPKSSRPERVKENFSVTDFKIEEEDMAVMLDWDENFTTGWDPTRES
jgi:diketogulonate reductase-like aldo/keto reductase